MIKGTYHAKQFNLSGLNGISDRTLETHFKLYEGYVKGTNDLNQRIADIKPALGDVGGVIALHLS